MTLFEDDKKEQQFVALRGLFAGLSLGWDQLSGVQQQLQEVITSEVTQYLICI